MIWLNNYYITVSGTVTGNQNNDTNSAKTQFIQSFGVNGDFLGYPIYGEYNIIGIFGDSLRVEMEVRTNL